MLNPGTDDGVGVDGVDSGSVVVQGKSVVHVALHRTVGGGSWGLMGHLGVIRVCGERSGVVTTRNTKFLFTNVKIRVSGGKLGLLLEREQHDEALDGNSLLVQRSGVVAAGSLLAPPPGPGANCDVPDYSVVVRVNSKNFSVAESGGGDFGDISEQDNISDHNIS